MDVGPRHPRQPEDEKSRQQGRQEHSGRRQDEAGSKHRPYGRQARRHTAREKYDVLRHNHIPELYAQPVAAESHAHKQEDKEEWKARAIAGFAYQYARYKKHRTKEQYILATQYHI